MKTLDDSAWQV